MNPCAKSTTGPLRPCSTALPTLLIRTCLAACGGGNGAAERDRAQGAAEPISTLLADDGTSLPPAPDTIPSDAASHTQLGRYASSLQAEQLERALGEGVLRVNVECCGIEAVDQAIGIAHGMQAASDLPDSAPVLVRAADLRLGAAAANRMSAAGHANVWLVTR